MKCESSIIEGVETCGYSPERVLNVFEGGGACGRPSQRQMERATSGLVRTAACSPASRTGGTGERQADRNQSCCWAKTPVACSRFHAAKASFIPRRRFLDKKLIKVWGGVHSASRDHIRKVIIGSFHRLRGTNCKRITDRHVECNQQRSSDPGTSSMSVLLSHTHVHT